MAVFEGFQFREETGELLHLVFLELEETVDVFLHLTVVGERVIIFAETEGGGVEAAGDFERGDAGRISLEREGDEIVEDGEIGDEAGVCRLGHAG